MTREDERKNDSTPCDNHGVGEKRALSRRTFLQNAAAFPCLLGASAHAANQRKAKPVRKTKVAVIGAGAFGGWTALHLLKQGAKVMLLDAWGAGNSRASSGGDTRVIRGAYGGDADYIEWVARSFVLWQEAEARWRTKVYHRTGSLWMYAGDDRHARSSIEPLRKRGLEIQHWSLSEAARRFPQLRFDGIQSVYYEPEAGYLMARRSCELVRQSFVSEGGEFQQASVRPGRIEARMMREINLEDGTSVRADAFVFACGPWLGKIFPDVIGNLISPTRQEVYFFGAPAGDQRFNEEHLPIWVAFGKRVIYCLPGNERRGLKVCDDTRGEPFDPTDGDRTPTPALIQIVREELRVRLPDLAEAPLLEARVCQYEDTPDKNLIIDRHPEAGNVWFVGGGSGHGFKFGPALGEHVAHLILGKQQPKARFQLFRSGLINKGDSF